MFKRFLWSGSLVPYVFYAGDDKSGGGANDDTDKTDDGDGDGDGQTNDDGDGKTPGAITFASQAELQKHIDSLLKDRIEREQRKAQKLADDAKAKAEADALIAQGKFQELAESQAIELANLKPLVEQIEAEKAETERYRKAMTTMLESQRAELPAPIIALLDRLDPLEQLEWISKNAAELTSKDGDAKAGIKASPKGDNGTVDDEEARKQAYRVRF
jgi:hypothetical protein